MEERVPLGVERIPSAAGRPVSKTGIVILALIIILACVFIYFYSPKLTEPTTKEPAANKPPNAGFTYTPTSPVITSPVHFIDSSTDSDGSIVNHTWDFGDGNVSYENSPSHQYAAPDTYTVNLTVQDNSGAIDSELKSITVLAYYHFVGSDTINGSSDISPDENANLSAPYCTEYSFDVFGNATWVNITVSYSVVKLSPTAPDSRVDSYIYYSEGNQSAYSDKSSNSPKAISLNAQQIAEVGYGKWSAVLHHYSDRTSPLTSATYTIEIYVIY